MWLILADSVLLLLVAVTLGRMRSRQTLTQGRFAGAVALALSLITASNVAVFSGFSKIPLTVGIILSAAEFGLVFVVSKLLYRRMLK